MMEWGRPTYPVPPAVRLPGIGLDESTLGSEAHTKNINSVAWNNTGARLATGSDDKTARVYDVDDTGNVKPLLKLDAHTDGVVQVCWDPTSPHRLATLGERDKTVRLFDVRASKPTLVLKMAQE